MNVSSPMRPAKSPLTAYFWSTAPAIVILLASLAISLFVTEFVFVSGITALWKILFRFVRTSLMLIVPLLLLPRICALLPRLFLKSGRSLVQIREESSRSINLFEAWVVRPLQGIGLCMLIAVKLIGMLQLYTGSTVSASLVFPSGGFQFGKFMTMTAIFVVASILLSLLWTLDDLGVRHYSKKTGEVRMIGKYLGVLLPIIFGFYGLTSLYGQYASSVALTYVGQMALVLYPPFLVFAVTHYRYMQVKEDVLLHKLNALPFQMMRSDEVPSTVKE